MIHHSKEEGDLDTFVYSFHRPSLSSSFFLYPKLSKARVIVVGVNETGLTPLGEPMPNFFSGSDLVFLCRGWGCYLHDSFISIIHSVSLLHMSK